MNRSRLKHIIRSHNDDKLLISRSWWKDVWFWSAWSEQGIQPAISKYYTFA